MTTPTQGNLFMLPQGTEKKAFYNTPHLSGKELIKQESKALTQKHSPKSRRY